MKKKILSMILATTMILGASMTAFAADPNEITDITGAASGQEITGSSTVNLPVIEVTVPTTADIIINPFQLSYEDTDAGITGNSQIISAVQEITSASNVALNVNVSELKATSDTVTLSTSAITEKVTNKSAFLYLEVVGGEEEFAAAYDKSKTSQVIIPQIKDGDTKTKPATKEAIVTLAAGDETEQTAQFKIAGNVVANPMGEDSDGNAIAAPWTEDDEIGISFKFTFVPQVAATE